MQLHVDTSYKSLATLPYYIEKQGQTSSIQHVYTEIVQFILNSPYALSYISLKADKDPLYTYLFTLECRCSDTSISYKINQERFLETLTLESKVDVNDIVYFIGTRHVIERFFKMQTPHECVAHFSPNLNNELKGIALKIANKVNNHFSVPLLDTTYL